MIYKGLATADEMILAFLQAEVDSPRYALHYVAALASIGAHRTTLIDGADLRDPVQNAQRGQILGLFRGYERDLALFQGFPRDALWRRVSVTPTELATFRYANHEVWLLLTRQSRRVADGAANLGTVQTGEDTEGNVKGVAQRVQGGHTFPPLIAAQRDTSDIVLIEGHTRATAYVLGGSPSQVDMLIGTSAEMDNWVFY